MDHGMAQLSPGCCPLAAVARSPGAKASAEPAVQSQGVEIHALLSQPDSRWNPHASGRARACCLAIEGVPMQAGHKKSPAEGRA